MAVPRYARVSQGRVVEFIEPVTDIEIQFPGDILVWVDVTGRTDVQVGWAAVETPDGWVLSEYVPPPLTPDQLLMAQRAILQELLRVAIAQRNALTNRVAQITDAVEFDMVTDEELEELPIRQAQLVEWKKHNILLGRVTAQPGWFETVDWPVPPKQGMDLNVSARSVSTQ